MSINKKYYGLEINLIPKPSETMIRTVKTLKTFDTKHERDSWVAQATDSHLRLSNHDAKLYMLYAMSSAGAIEDAEDVIPIIMLYAPMPAVRAAYDWWLDTLKK